MLGAVPAIAAGNLKRILRGQASLAASRSSPRLGQVSAPLALVSVNGERKLIVSPWAALGTDVLGMAVATALFFSTENTWLRVLAAVGGTWAATALFKELGKLVDGPERKIVLVEE
ncbi:MAG: hypothetical protein A3E01_07890 [Gammaproteobacteria bacterium RIFCSPHIGHO2_12_FULL_63_22]|nr:MAG: hypothetical protein A3E01_07890 [Gammaproteobacteria bacterium RIFCSPHIGHO2_12_FULL_63_22]